MTYAPAAATTAPGSPSTLKVQAPWRSSELRCKPPARRALVIDASSGMSAAAPTATRSSGRTLTPLGADDAVVYGAGGGRSAPTCAPVVRATTSNTPSARSPFIDRPALSDP